MFRLPTLLLTSCILSSPGLAAAPSPVPGEDPALAQLDKFVQARKIDLAGGTLKTALPQPPMLTFDPKMDYFWTIQTNQGAIMIRLMPEVAPMHVSSTIFLSRIGFYDGLKFHRVISQFMAQGGCPLGNGTGGPGYKYAGEFSPSVRHDRPGLLSMANAGPGTDGSQFFLTFMPAPHLNDKHTIFGEIVEGMNVLGKLEKCGSRSGQPSEPLNMKKTFISVAPKQPESPGVEGDPQEVIANFIAEQELDLAAGTARTRLPKPPKCIFPMNKQYFWHIQTNLGLIKIRLRPDVAPMHVSSTVYLATLGFYDGLTFHRVIPRFMAQGGCPNGDGRGGPGYKYAGEFSPQIRHDRPGLLSMANAGPGTDGSQFFLTFVPTPHLNGKHTIFGEIVEGMDVLNAMEERGSRAGQTSERLVMEKTTIVVK